jgi:hypothetical protein
MLRSWVLTPSFKTESQRVELIVVYRLESRIFLALGYAPDSAQ